MSTAGRSRRAESYVMEHIREAGIEEVGIVVSPETGCQIQDFLGKTYFGLRLTYIQQEQPLGLAHAVKVSRDYLGDDSFVMYLGDNLIRDGIVGFIEGFRSSRSDAAVLLKEVPADVAGLGTSFQWLGPGEADRPQGAWPDPEVECGTEDAVGRGSGARTDPLGSQRGALALEGPKLAGRSESASGWSSGRFDVKNEGEFTNEELPVCRWRRNKPQAASWPRSPT